MAHVRRRGAKWQARYRGPDGRERSQSFDRKGDAQRWLASVVTDLTRGDWIDPLEAKRTTVGSFAAAWMAAQPWRPSTRERVASVWRNHLEPTFGAMPMSTVRTSQVQAHAARLAQALAPATVEAAIRLLSSVYAAAVTDGVARRNPVTAVKLPRTGGALRVPLTAKQVADLAAKINGDLSLAVDLAAQAGLRQGELFGLTWDRVAWLTRELVIDRQLVTSKGSTALGPVKTSRSVRRVPLTDDMVQRLAGHPRTGEFVFMRGDRPWQRSRAADAMRSAIREAGVPARGWHDLRHYCASTLIREGLSVTAVAATLGHSPAECLKTYAGWWPDEHELVRAAMTRAAAVTPRSAGSEQWG